MKILPITKPTKKDKIELEKLRTKSKIARLTDREAAREVFLSVKDLWDCEC